MVEILKETPYDLRGTFLPMLGVTANTYQKRRVDLLEWLKEFYDYELIYSRPIVIIIHEIYGEFQPLPRKNAAAKEERIKDYDDYVKAHLKKTFAPESKLRMARNAIEDFSHQKYGHTNAAGVAARYTGPSMEKLGEKSDYMIWVTSDCYQPMSKQMLDKWRDILRKHKIAQEEAANAFYRQANGEDISEEINSYKAALNDFQIEYGMTPICVHEWRLAATE